VQREGGESVRTEKQNAGRTSWKGWVLHEKEGTEVSGFQTKTSSFIYFFFFVDEKKCGGCGQEKKRKKVWWLRAGKTNCGDLQWSYSAGIVLV